MKNIVIVLNYNDADQTIDFCKYVSLYQIIDVILIVDNNSTDDSMAQFKLLESEKIKIIQAKENQGYAAGNNIGMKYVLEYYSKSNIVISNPDIYISEDNLIKILKALSSPNIGLSTGIIYNRYGNVVSNYGWKLPTYWKLIGSNFLLIYKIMKMKNKGLYLSKLLISEDISYIKCDCVPGCFFCTTSDVIKKIGMLDERTFLYGEENILGYKLKEYGYDVCIINDTRVNHIEGHSIIKQFNSKLKRRKITKASLKIYLEFYLKVGRLKLLIYDILFWIAMLEQDMVMKLMKLVMK